MLVEEYMDTSSGKSIKNNKNTYADSKNCINIYQKKLYLVQSAGNTNC